MTSTSSAPRGDDEVAVALLADLGTFPGATRADLAAIVAAGYVVSVPQGWSLIWDRTPADKAYVILDGTVEVRRDDEVVATLTAGQVIGEVAILRRQLRSATVTATTQLTVLHFGRETVERLYAEVPAVRDALVASAEAHS
ncbi:MAG: cyclic nucleotide-binding domain-containing protein [Microbacterium sp.]|nr:MAG: cyclic nucleotide-binding domain-containing protein [Microbacterium sp.]